MIFHDISQFLREGGGLRSHLEIFFVLTHLKIWIMCDMNILTELENFERCPRLYEKWERTRTLRTFWAICREFYVNLCKIVLNFSSCQLVSKVQKGGAKNYSK